jgi:CubicO group peptidase (beta-lactamase class C family)
MKSMVETDMVIMWVLPIVGQPRDWSKFGLLYLHKGKWNGEQILDESWVKYVAIPLLRQRVVMGRSFG